MQSWIVRRLAVGSIGWLGLCASINMRNVEIHRVATMGKRVENDFCDVCAAIKSNRPLNRRAFSVGISLRDDAVRRILEGYKGSSHNYGSLFRGSVANQHMQSALATRWRRLVVSLGLTRSRRTFVKDCEQFFV